MSKFSVRDVQELIGNARASFMEMKVHGRLPEMNRALEFKELVALSYFNATLNYLNRQGALAPGWLEQNQIELDVPDSEPEVDDDADSAANAEEPS